MKKLSTICKRINEISPGSARIGRESGSDSDFDWVDFDSVCDSEE